MLFIPKLEPIGYIRRKFKDEEIKNEPMFFCSDYEFCFNNGKIITRNVLLKLQEILKGTELEIKEAIIDTRSHMLMQGFYPCIPGWHHDDIPRTRDDGQPNYYEPGVAKHVIFIINADISTPEFIIDPVTLEIPLRGVVYQSWDKILTEMVHSGNLKTRLIKDHEVLLFDSHTFHRGCPAIYSGWRWFIRLSWKTDRKIKNEIRNQVQVYLTDTSTGW